MALKTSTTNLTSHSDRTNTGAAGKRYHMISESELRCQLNGHND